MATRAFHIFKALLWILTCCALAQASPPPGARSACCEVVERVDQFVQTESSTREHGFAGEVARPEAEGRGAVEQSLVRSRGRAGGGTYWGRVGAASAGGALGGAITAAVPAAGLVAVLGIGGASTTATGLAERAIVSGGKDLGTARDIAIDAGVGMLTAGVVRGGSKVVQSLRAAKPAGSATTSTASSNTTTVGYHATYPEAASSILESGFRMGTKPARLGTGGVYVNNSTTGAAAEFAHHNPGVTPTILKVKYELGINGSSSVAPRGYVSSHPLDVNSLSAPSLRAPGTINTNVLNGSARATGVVK